MPQMSPIHWITLSSLWLLSLLLIFCFLFCSYKYFPQLPNKNPTNYIFNW